MKRTMNAAVEEKILRRAKLRAVREGRSLSDLVQDALVQYLGKETATPQERRMAYRLFCETPMQIPTEQLRYVFDDGVWDF